MLRITVSGPRPGRGKGSVHTYTCVPREAECGLTRLSPSALALPRGPLCRTHEDPSEQLDITFLLGPRKEQGLLAAGRVQEGSEGSDFTEPV